VRGLIVSISCLSLLAACSGKQPEAADTGTTTETASVAPVSNGEKVFAKCMACHSLEAGKNLIGPSLHGIVGRKAASLEGFMYSDAMKASGIIWTEDQLSEYLTQPQKKVPGTRMSFPGLPTEQDRTDVIAYLKDKAK
jgi:cytochrome c